MALGKTADPNARGWALDACYGGSHSTKWPSTLQLALIVGDPVTTGTELTAAGGYARVTIANSLANFPDSIAPNWNKLLAVQTDFAASTGAWSGAADHWAFYSPDGHLLDSGPIVDATTGNPATVTVSQSNVTVRVVANKLIVAVT